MSLPLFCETSGAGPSVVCLHGFGCSSYTWRELRGVLETAHTVHTFDLKGHGRSPKPRDGRYSVHDQAALVIECIDAMGLSGLVLAGHSFGGGVALVTALALLKQRPGALRGLILVDAASYRQPIPPFMRTLRWPLLGPLIQAIAPITLQVRMVMKVAYYHDDRVPESTIDAYSAALRESGGKYALRETAKQIVPADIDELCERYKTISVPALVIWGAHDEIIPLEFGDRLKRAIPDSRLVVVPESGHMPHEETPEPVRAEVTRFLAERCQ